MEQARRNGNVHLRTSHMMMMMMYNGPLLGGFNVPIKGLHKPSLQGYMITQTIANLRDKHATRFACHVLRLLRLMLRRIEDWSLHRSDSTWHRLTSWTQLSTTTYMNRHMHLECRMFTQHFCVYRCNTLPFVSYAPFLTLQCYPKQIWTEQSRLWTKTLSNVNRGSLSS